MTRFVIAAALALAIPQLLRAQADTTGPTLGLRFVTEPLALRPPDALSAPWLGAPRGTPAPARFDSALTQLRDSLGQDAARTRLFATIYKIKAQPVRDTTTNRRGLLGIDKNLVDVSFQGNTHFDARVERIKNLRCNSASIIDPNSSCTGSGFRAPRLDNSLNVQAKGLLGRRLHLDIDYDTQRDLATKNDLQIYYEGLDDEIIQRIEVGTVTFQPPPSRFITASTPLNNFGVNASFEVGPLQIQGLVATQKGSTVAQRTFTIGTTTTQPQDRQVRDLDFEPGRFFWVQDPARVPGYPNLDILNLEAGLVPANIRPAAVRVYRYRPATGQGGINPNLGGITAVARRSDSPQRVGPLPSGWQLMVQGQDYYLDPSGLWFFLAARLDVNDYLAVSYITATGDTVGTFPQADNPARKDSLELIVEPKVSAALPTFRYEMRQVYRVAGSDLDRNSLKVGITVNRSAAPLKGGSPTYLGQLGLAIQTDPSQVDLENRVFPRLQDPVPDQVSRDQFLIFPSAQPFADSTRLTASELQDSIYRTPYYLLFQEGPPAKFLIRMQYNSTGAGDENTLNLNALAITEGSEILTLNGRSLERGVDYTIAYDLGQVTFLNPGALFGGQPATVDARFEERGLFAVAPTQLYGFSTRYSMGDLGGVSLIGIYQAEQSAYNRPVLGFEATSNLVGGVTTDLHFKPQAVTRFLNKLTSAPATALSRLDLNAEVAFTRPNQNRAGQAYVEDFEGDNGVQLSLRETAWQFGSVPQSSLGVDAIVGAAFDSADATQMIWQNLVPNGAGGVIQLKASDIDPQIQTAGGDNLFENILNVTLQGDTTGGYPRNNPARDARWTQPARPGSPRWRTMVTPLSTTGLDLTRDEFLEFWVFQGDNARSADSSGVQLVVDLGTVSEDALALAPLNFAVSGNDTTFSGRQYVGVGHLDTERDSLTQVWNATDNDTGILSDRPDSLIGPGGIVVRHPALCQIQLSSTISVYRQGDMGSRCTNGNGFADNEDLNGDGVLNATGSGESVYRWVVDPTSLKYFVRDGRQRSDSLGGWKLYRIPIRTPDQVIGTPDIRLIRALRITVVAPVGARSSEQAQFSLARMRLLGAPWVRRSATPVASLAGSLGEPHGDIEVSLASTEDIQLGYVSPPGVFGGVDKKSGNAGDLGIRINEQSLRIVASDLRIRERAEAYFRVLGGSQNLLKYSRLRVWFRGRGSGWDEGDYRAYIRVGTDDGNFYQYSAPARTTTWNPEAIIDLNEWVTLRTALEIRFLGGQPADSAQRVACGGDTVSTAYVACSDGYVVYLSDPAVRPPNLSAVQEFAAGILRTGTLTGATDAELWVDDIRLDQPVSNTGRAMAFDARFIASDVADMTFSYVDQNGYFQQIDQTPTYQSTQNINFAGGIRLDRFLPTSLGLSLPLTVALGRTSTDPVLFTGSDIRADEIVGLRKPSSWNSAFSLGIRRQVIGKSWATRVLLDPLSFAGTYSTGSNQSEYSAGNGNAYTATIAYLGGFLPRGRRLGLAGVASHLPGFLRDGVFGKSLAKATITPFPNSVRLQSGLTRTAGEQSTYLSPIFLVSDTAVIPVFSLTNYWRNSAGFSWQPLGMLRLSSDLSSTRDLRRYSDSTTLGRVATAGRKSFLGLDVGVEQSRNLSTVVNLTPHISSWLQPRFSTTSGFFLLRNLTSIPPIRTDPDSTFLLPQTLNNTRGRELGFSIDAAKLVGVVLGDSSSGARSIRGLRPIDYSDRFVRSSSYDLAAFDPDLSYMLALGGLDDFLNHQGERAIAVTETRTGTLSTGGTLGFGLSIQASYSRIRTSRLQLQGDDYQLSETIQKEWPSGTLRLTRNLKGGPLAVVSAGASYRQRTGVTLQSGQGANQTTTTSTTLNPDLQLIFRNGISMTFRYLDTRQDNRAFNNSTQSTQQTINGAVSYSLRLPESISRSRKALRTSLTGSYTAAINCLASQGSADCRTLSDVRRQEAQASMDTELFKMLTGGVQLGYVLDDARSLDRKIQQFYLSLNFSLSLFAGDYR